MDYRPGPVRMRAVCISVERMAWRETPLMQTLRGRNTRDVVVVLDPQGDWQVGDRVNGVENSLINSQMHPGVLIPYDCHNPVP